MVHYFAYGSNLDSGRLRARVPSARAETRALLRGYRWRCNKRGRDGSAKANIEAWTGGSVWGVVYAMEAGSLEVLDHYEGGYARIRVEVEGGGAPRLVDTYVSTQITPDERPTAEYRGYLVSGAREHALPAEFLRLVEALQTTERG